MVFYITCLKALAACLITNAHYEGIYPTDLLANGGLIGDILFFAVSGYCLYRVKQPFVKWYAKRLWRVYPPVLLITAVYLLVGAYSLGEHSAAWWFVYPTYYHFVASILVLYIPYYIIVRTPCLRERLPLLMAVVALAWVVVYLTVYDRSYYHIDTVREPMIRFLFMESMLMGAWFRQQDGRFRNRFHWLWPVGAAVCFAGYFASKLLFSRGLLPARYQLCNQIVIFALLFALFGTFSGLDGKLSRLPDKLRRCVGFIADLTLEIYVVQYVLIWHIGPMGHFPLNWLALTAAILAAAYALHMVCRGFYKIAGKIGRSITGR